MKHYSNILFGTAICSSILLSGCALFEKEKPVQPQPVKTAADNKKAAEEKDLALAKFMFEHQNDVKAFEMFVKYAEQGNTEAEAWLGRCYMNGIGTPVNYDKAFEYFSKAAAKNHPYGINGLGVCKQYGYGTDIDLRAAIEFYKKAAAMNFPLAILNLARTYSDKLGGFYDEKLAEEYFKKAISVNAKGGNSVYASYLIERNRHAEALALVQNSKDFFSMMTLADCYENGWGVATDIKKSIALRIEASRSSKEKPDNLSSFFIAGLEELVKNGQTEFANQCIKFGAEYGDRECQFFYADNLKKRGLNDEAIKYMKKAADQGYFLAQLEAGTMLKEKKDYEGAIKYFTLATLSEQVKVNAIKNLSALYNELNDLKSKKHWDLYGFNLGSLYCLNELADEKLIYGKNDDIAQAAAWFAVAMIQADEYAKNRFFEILEKDYERLRKLADSGNGNALFSLGVLGCMSKKPHPNIPVGIALLEKAAKQKNMYACNVLGNFYFNGEIVPKDLKKALAWYRQGAELKNVECALLVVTLLRYEEEFKKTPVEELKAAFEKCIALNEYSILYEYGLFMEKTVKDLKKAEELYRWAAKQGDTRAMIYLHNLLLKNNPDDAWAYLWKAVDLHDQEAEFTLGELNKFANRPRNAYAMYLKSVMHGNSSEAASRLAECYLTGYGCEPDAKMFWEFANTAYKNGSGSICLIIGNVYRDGKICPRDLKKAGEYYAEGAKRGNQECEKALKTIK